MGPAAGYRSEMTGTHITPFLWFNDCADEAMAFYTGLFPDSAILHVERYPDESLDEHFKGMAGKVITGVFTLAGRQFMCLDGGGRFPFTEAVSLLVECADQAEIDRYWAALSAVPEAEACGWCKDRFGLSWQIVPADMGSLLSSPQAVQAMMKMTKIVIADLEAAAG